MTPSGFENRSSLIASVLFHVAVVVGFTVGWPFLKSPEITAQPLIIVDLVDIVEETNLASAQKSDKSSEVEQKETRRRPPPPPPPAPPPPKPAPAPEPPRPQTKPAAQPNVAVADAEILPDKDVAIPKAKPKRQAPRAAPVEVPKSRPRQQETPQTPSPKPQQAVQKSSPPVATPVARPNKLIKKTQQKQKASALSGVLQNLADVSKAEKAEENKKAKQKQAQKTLAQNLTQAVGDAAKATESQKQLKLGQSEFDRLRQHISRCWAPPLGAKGGVDLKVDLLLELERDGSVRQASFMDKRRYNSDKIYKVAADAALRAVIECAPLPLPVEKYELWKKFIFGFDPKFM